jgi:hypothetical protein
MAVKKSRAYIFGNKERISRLVDVGKSCRLSWLNIFSLKKDDIIYTNHLRSPTAYLIKKFRKENSPLILGVSDGLLSPLLLRKSGKPFLAGLPTDQIIMMQVSDFGLSNEMPVRNLFKSFDEEIITVKQVDELIVLLPNNPFLDITENDLCLQVERILAIVKPSKISISAQSRSAAGLARKIKSRIKNVKILKDPRIEESDKQNRVIVTGPSSTFLYGLNNTPIALSFLSRRNKAFFSPLELFDSNSEEIKWKKVSFIWDRKKHQEKELLSIKRQPLPRLQEFFDLQAIIELVKEVARLLWFK